MTSYLAALDPLQRAELAVCLCYVALIAVVVIKFIDEKPWRKPK